MKLDLSAFRSDSAVVAVLVAGLAGLQLVQHATGESWRNEWKLGTLRSGGKVHFTIRRSEGRSNWTMSTDVPLDRFRGLPADTFGRSGPAKFEYVLEAGKLLCEGSFSLWGGGSGTYTVEANPRFVSELVQLGYGAPDENQILSIMLSNITLEFARTVRDAGLRATTNELIELRNHGVTTEFVRDVRSAGYKEFTVRDFIDLRNHGVNAQFLEDLKAAGYNFQARDAIELRNHGVPAEFARVLRKAGYDLSSNRIAELRNHGVNSDFIQDLKSFGLRPSAPDLIQLRSHGVSADYLHGLKSAGYGEVPVQQVIDLRSHGVNLALIKEARDLGFQFTPRELMDLQSHGVSGPYLRRIRESGMKNLTAQQIVKLRDHGID